MKIYWGDTELVIESKEALMSAVQAALVLHEPTMIFLYHDNGQCLVFGVGHPESVLTFASNDGTTFHSKGDTSRTDRLLFRCRDQTDEFMGEMAIPETLAIKAAHDFFDTGAQPPGIDWERDW